jgi:hypothetical protein
VWNFSIYHPKGEVRGRGTPHSLRFVDGHPFSASGSNRIRQWNYNTDYLVRYEEEEDRRRNRRRERGWGGERRGKRIQPQTESKISP